MPVVGLPTALEVTLGALLQENNLTSWKITAEGHNTTIVLRLKSDPAQNNMACGQPTPVAAQCFRKKPPSQMNRDRRRAEERRGAAIRQEDSKASERFAFENSPVLFMPTPPASHPVSRTDTLSSPNSTLQETARECRRASRDVDVLDTDSCVDTRREIDLADVPSTDTTEANDCNGPLETAEEAGYSVDIIKDYVAELTDRSLQRRLRNTRRNLDFRNVLSCVDEPDTVVCESDDVVFQFQWTDDSDKPTNFFWFAKRDTKLMTNEERTIYNKLRLWTPADREKLKNHISAGLDVQCVIMDAVRFFLG